MDDSRIRDVSSLLSSFFDADKLRRGERYSDFFSSWPALVGARLAAHSRVVDVDKGLLVIEADHPGWIQLLQMRQTGILDAVAQRFPELGLRGIVFRVSGQGGIVRSQAVVSQREEQKKDNEPEKVSKESGSGTSLDEPSRIEEPEDPAFRALFESLKRTMREKD
jgi:hypothetical protein